MMMMKYRLLWLESAGRDARPRLNQYRIFCSVDAGLETAAYPTVQVAGLPAWAPVTKTALAKP
jgi:hypothetical protein